MYRELVDRAKRGDEEAFDALARKVGDRCMPIACRILRDVDRAEDAVQAALIVAWRELRTLRDPERFEPWLHRILTNECYAEARRRTRWSTDIRVLPTEESDGRPYLDHRRPRRARARLPEADPRAAGRARLPPLRRAPVAPGCRPARHSPRDREVATPPRHEALRASLEADARTPRSPRSDWHDRATRSRTQSSRPSLRTARWSCRIGATMPSVRHPSHTTAGRHRPVEGTNDVNHLTPGDRRGRPRGGRVRRPEPGRGPGRASGRPARRPSPYPDPRADRPLLPSPTATRGPPTPGPRALAAGTYTTSLVWDVPFTTTFTAAGRLAGVGHRDCHEGSGDVRLVRAGGLRLHRTRARGLPLCTRPSARASATSRRACASGPMACCSGPERRWSHSRGATGSLRGTRRPAGCRVRPSTNACRCGARAAGQGQERAAAAAAPTSVRPVRPSPDLDPRCRRALRYVIDTAHHRTRRLTDGASRSCSGSSTRSASASRLGRLAAR